MSRLLILQLCVLVCQARRFYDTSLPILSEVEWLPEQSSSHATNAFVGSPSIVAVPNASSASVKYLASHDRFFHIPKGTAYIFASNDLVEWQPTAQVSPMYWAQLFSHGEQVYIIGTSNDMTTAADIVISRCLSSPCDGSQWSESVAIFKGNATHSFHCAPTPVVEKQGTLYRAFEVDISNVPQGNLAVIMLEGNGACSDLTLASCWKMSAPITFSPAWAPIPTSRTWEEAGAVLHPNGTIYTMVRLDGPVENCETFASCNRAALLRYDENAKAFNFHSLVGMPTSCNKFAIKTASDNQFYSLTNPVTHVPVTAFGTKSCGQRNVVALTTSTDLVQWKTCEIVLHDDTGLALNDSLKYTGMQYIDFIIEEPHMYAAVRSSYRGATTYHDANRLLIANISNFRDRCK